MASLKERVPGLLNPIIKHLLEALHCNVSDGQSSRCGPTCNTEVSLPGRHSPGAAATVHSPPEKGGSITLRAITNIRIETHCQMYSLHMCEYHVCAPAFL